MKCASRKLVVLRVEVVGLTVALAAVAPLSYAVDQVGPVECELSCWCVAVVTEATEVKVNGVVLGLELQKLFGTPDVRLLLLPSGRWRQ